VEIHGRGRGTYIRVRDEMTREWWNGTGETTEGRKPSAEMTVKGEQLVSICSWCDKVAGTHFSERHACETHEHLLQREANETLREIDDQHGDHCAARTWSPTNAMRDASDSIEVEKLLAERLSRRVASKRRNRRKI